MAAIQSTQSDQEIQRLVGGRLRAHRLRNNVRIEDLAHRAGLGSATVKKAEHGEDVRLSTLIKLLRAFDRLEAFDALLPEPPVSPIALSKMSGKTRQRARRRQDD
jgi:transcriptional regulator with XRE-family HTH domain